MGKFKRYNSIENSYRTKYLDTLRNQALDGGEWVVQEKAHGANFSLWYDGKGDIKPAKRSGFIKGDENFYGHETVVKNYEDKIKNLYKSLQLKEDQVLAVYGEIIGGHYEGYKKTEGAFKVQKEVQYCPHNDFYAFDIMVDGKFLDLITSVYTLNFAGFPTANILYQGSLEKCLEYENDFITKIPSIFDLPDLEGNICEGVVIKPIEEKYTWNNSRVLLKNKNEKFSEKGKQPKTPKEPIQLSEDGDKMMVEILSYINENRLRNVISKIGTITDRDFGFLMGALNKDTIEDFMKDNRDKFITLDKKEQKTIIKEINKQNANMIRPNFINIIDGNF